MNSESLLINLASSLLPVQSLITGAAYIMGIGFIMKALLALKSHGESRAAMSQNSSLKEPLLFFFVGGMFIYFPTGFSIIMNTTFGYSTVLSYSQDSTINDWVGGNSELGTALTTIIQTIGLYAFIKGWVMVTRSSSGQPPGGIGKGLTHVFGGVLAVNIVGTVEIVNNTLTGA